MIHTVAVAFSALLLFLTAVAIAKHDDSTRSTVIASVLVVAAVMLIYSHALILSTLYT